MTISTKPLIVLSIPGLRGTDVARMPKLAALVSSGNSTPLIPSFPCVTWPVQTNMLTGKLPAEHGVIANGIYERDSHRVEMWTAPSDISMSPWIWDTLRSRRADIRTAVWFPMLAKGCQADFACMPAPVHNPDGSETPWCYSRPSHLYGELLKSLGHFPLMNFWGPLAGIASSRWIARSAAHVATEHQPDFLYIYLPHLDYAAQKVGPNSPAAISALAELDGVIGELGSAMGQAYAPINSEPSWIVASEYVITDVSHVEYPNRILREAGLLSVQMTDAGELIDLVRTPAWALVDHQFAHVFLAEATPTRIGRVKELFAKRPGIDRVLDRAEQFVWGMGHPRGGDLVLVSNRDSWQAYYWWLQDEQAPAFARTVDIHRKPGYDPVELHFDPVRRGIPLNATLIGGSHGAPARDSDQHGVLLASGDVAIPSNPLRDIDLHQIILRHFGI